MYGPLQQHLQNELDAIAAAGLKKNERIITTPQAAHIRVGGGAEVLNFCANNYLGLADNAELIAASKAALDHYGFGLSSVRFICGTQDQHKALEAAVSRFLTTEDTILYGSCFDANGGLFETLLGPEDAIVSDALNHASIIDGIRLAKAKRYRYEHLDLVDLDQKLQQATDDIVQGDHQVVEGDGGGEVGVAVEQGHCFGGGDVLHHHFQFWKALG